MATTFIWKGRSPSGELLSGEYQAETKEDLVSHLRKRKIIITSMREKAKGNIKQAVTGAAPSRRGW